LFKPAEPTTASTPLVTLEDAPPPGRKGGRPCKLNVATASAIIELVEKGVPINTAAQQCGISADAIAEWLRRGLPATDVKTGKPIAAPAAFVAFRERLLAAQARAESTMVEHLATAAVTDPKAAQFWLERRAPQHWSKTDKLEVVTEPRPSTWNLSALDADDLAHLERIAIKAGVTE
jgi:hypothetical protein